MSKELEKDKYLDKPNIGGDKIMEVPLLYGTETNEEKEKRKKKYKDNKLNETN